MLRCWGIEPLVISLGVFLGVSICTTIERRKGYREIVLLTPFNKNAFRDAFYWVHLSQVHQQSKK